MNEKIGKELPLSGLILVKKGIGETSHDVIKQLRRILNIKRIGHCGTLDPFAEGLMMILIGEATSFQQDLMKLDKEYEGIFVFGKETDTLDLTGEIVNIDEKEIDLRLRKEAIEKIIEVDFMGKILQVPPKFSAIKVNGRRAYDFSRKGEAIELKAREVSIKKFEILEINRGSFKGLIECGSGTYIRSIVRDLAYKLGTFGYVEKLVRKKINDYSLKDAICLKDKSKEEIKQRMIGISKWVKGFKILVESKDLNKLKNGDFSNFFSKLSRKFNNLFLFNDKIILVVKVNKKKRLKVIYNELKYIE